MIRVTRDGAVSTIALARTEAQNALPIASWEALAVAAQEVADSRAVILCSDMQGVFSSGADVREFEQLQADPVLRTRFRQAMRTGIEAVASIPVPVIAAIDGGCFGAAVALILAADIRVAGDHAKFAVTPAKLGLGYPQEDVARLIARVGRGTAASLLFTGDWIGANDAKLVRLVELRSKKALTVAKEIALNIAGNAPNAVRLLKRAMSGPDAGLDQAFEDAFGGAEFAEGLAAFRERRRPEYR